VEVSSPCYATQFDGTDTQLNIVFFLLRNGVKARIPRDEMPEVEEEPAVPYSDDELKKLFSEMGRTGAIETVKGKEYTGPGFGQEIRYRFFLDSVQRQRSHVRILGGFRFQQEEILRSSEGGCWVHAEESRIANHPFARSIG
jgi:hypothetical protein